MDAAGSRHPSNVEQQGNASARLNEDEMGNKASRTMLHSEGTRMDRAEAASAFQRWKQYHLQRTFKQELKRVAESSLKDEASLATMERERAQREKELAYALADSASLRAQLTAKEEEIHALRSQTSAEEPESLPVASPEQAAPVELEDRPRSVEDLVWVNEPRVQPQRQEHRFSGLEHHLRELVTAIRRLDQGSEVDTAFLAEVQEAVRQVEQELDQKLRARLRRQSGRPLESRTQELDYCRKWDPRAQHDGDQVPAADVWRRRRSMREWHVIKQDGYNPDCRPLHHENVSKSVVWKWRWALAVSKSKTLSRHLKHLKALYKSQLSRNGSGNVEDSKPSREVGKLKLLMHKELARIMPSYSLVSFVVSIWRSYSCCSRTEKALLSRLIPIDKLMASFPLWVEKVGERQLLLYFFSLWQASRDRQEHQQRASAAGRCSPTNRRRATPQEAVPSIYEPFHHCCYPSSPTNESPRCSSPRRTVKSRPLRKQYEQEPMRTHKEADAEVEIVKSLPRNFCGHDNKAAGIENDNAAAASAFVGILGAAGDARESCIPSLPMSAPAQQQGTSFSAQALRRLELQLQHDLQDMQPILAKATKAIHDQITVDQRGRSFHDPRRATSTMSTLWKICAAVECALTEARNQMLCIIHDSARCEYEDPTNQQLQLPIPTAAEVSDQQQHDQQQPVVLCDDKRPRPSSGGFQSVFHLISRTSGLRRNSCLAAQYAAELNHKLQTNRFRNWL